MKQSPQVLSVLSKLRNDRKIPEIFAVTSGKGGVGKSFLSANIAILLGQLRRKVLLIDADIHLGNVDLMLGLRPKYSIADVLTGKVELRDIIISGPGGIDVMPASSGAMELLEMEDHVLLKLKDAFSQFEHEYDTVIVDTGSGIDKNVMSFVLSADKLILIATHDPASIADAYSMIKVIRQSQATIPILFTANMIKSESEGESLFNKMNLMVHRFLDSKINYGGTVLHTNSIAESIRQQKPIIFEQPNSSAVTTLKMIIRRLLNLPIKDISERAGLFDRIILHRNHNLGEES
jgi:flagellar biosynthesis protein FlhG